MAWADCRGSRAVKGRPDSQRIWPSLLDHFGPPSGFVGQFGLMCGYSGDAHFLDQAAELFTGQTSGPRAHAGQIALALMLDAGSAYLSPIDVPGLLHGRQLTTGQRSFRLLHAKVALLGYRAEDAQDERWHVRLIVSTGNWTRQTLEESLDVAWVIEVASDQLTNGSVVDSQDCADIRAANDLFGWLRMRFDLRVLTDLSIRGQPTQSQRRLNEMERWLSRISRKAQGVTPRFMDNRSQSFLKQLPGKIAACSGKAPRNSLFIASGFFEGGGSRDQVPSVLKEIVDSLQGHGLLVASARAAPNSPRGVHVVVNQVACQAVAASAEAIRNEGWTIRTPGLPRYFNQDVRRSLHAKFLFSANHRANSSACNGAWAYVGSGNITSPGFMAKAHAASGNLEAGVVFAPGELCWETENASEPSRALQNLLPIQWEEDIALNGLPLGQGEPMPERPEPLTAAPLGWLIWEPTEVGGVLRADAPLGDDLQVLDGDGRACSRDGPMAFRWLGSAPRQVTLRWMQGGLANTAPVIVIDEYGRIAPTELPKLGLAEAWFQLSTFPAIPNEEDDGLGESALAEDGDKGGDARRRRRTMGSHYAVRDLMTLVEDIAAKQTQMPTRDWAAWCVRLEQCLVQAADGPSVSLFRDLGVNPLSPLRHAAFRPSFAESDSTEEGLMYESVLERVVSAWRLQGLPGLEALT